MGFSMQIHLIAVGHKMPKWVLDGYQEFAKRLPAECKLKLVEIAPGRRSKSADVKRAIKDESGKMLAAIPKNAKVVALDERGKPWTTRQLAGQLEGWMGDGRDVALLVGGPDGLSDECRSRAEQQWSLSPLTLPHAMVRVLLSEQIYRAWSVMKGHPYHRD